MEKYMFLYVPMIKNIQKHSRPSDDRHYLQTVFVFVSKAF